MRILSATKRSQKHNKITTERDIYYNGGVRSKEFLKLEPLSRNLDMGNLMLRERLIIFIFKPL